MSGSTSTPATCSSQCVIAGEYGLNTPNIRLSTWATAPTAAHTTLQTLIGNMRPVTGTLEYGFLTGDYVGGHYIRLSGANAEVRGIPFYLDNVAIDTNGIAVTTSTGGVFATSHGYSFTSGIAGTPFGLFGDANGSVRTLGLSNTTTGTTIVTGTSMTAQSDANSSSIALTAYGSTTGVTPNSIAVITTDLLYLYGTGGGSGRMDIIGTGGVNTTLQPGFIGTRSSDNLGLLAGNSTKMTLFNGGGVTVGSPTGGDKGAGTLNATAVYDDNVLLTDWVFDVTLSRPATARLYSLDEVRDVTDREHRLPWMPKADEFETERKLGGMITRLWQGQEQQQLYLFDLERRLAALEQQQKGGKQ
jgi:hypothetical protein